MSDSKKRVVRDINKNGKIESWEKEAAEGKNPFAGDRTRGADPQFSADTEAANRNSKRRQAARIEKEMGDAEGYMSGGMVKGYRDGGMAVKGGKCEHRGTVRGTGKAIRGGKFVGTR